MLSNNFLRTKTLSRAKYTPSGTFDEESTETHTVEPGQLRQANAEPFRAVIQQGGNRASSDARGIRDELVSILTVRAKYHGNGTWLKFLMHILTMFDWLALGVT